MDPQRIARWSLTGSLAALGIGVLLAAVFTVLLATLPPPSAGGADFTSIYQWQQRVQLYTSFRELGQAFIIAAIPLTILAVALGATSSPATENPPPTIAPEPSAPIVARRTPAKK